MVKIEKYDVFELKIENVNETQLIVQCAVFKKNNKCITVSAFRNGIHSYMLRFMPEEEGIWSYHVAMANCEMQGEFECVKNTGVNHGRVVVNGYHFRYEDGERYIPFGTTAYAWIHQPAALQEQTLETLAGSSFNKVRMMVFPKSMPYNKNDPDCYPFLKNENSAWDVSNPDPIFWENLDCKIKSLMELGIEVDLILFHPYDRWGFSTLSQQESLIYLEYCINRLSAYRNIWWSLANEYELLYSKSSQDWDTYGEILLNKDIYGHLRSVHNIFEPYPKKRWLTHCSIQSMEINKIPIWQQEYELPVLIDECGYEGDLPYGWGSLTAFEMVHRFWWTACRGGFCTHGETYHREDEVLWWAKGGQLYGESEKRIAFLKHILHSLEGEWKMLQYKGINPNLDENDEKGMSEKRMFLQALGKASKEERERFVVAIAPMKIEGDGYSLEYFGRMRPRYIDLLLGEKKEYQVEILDIWDMTRHVAADKATGAVRIQLPAKEGTALLVTAVK